MDEDSESTIERLTRQFPRAGRVDAIVLRPRRGVAARSVPEVRAVAGTGLEGDRHAGGRRQVSLIQAEHLPVIAALQGLTFVDPALLRRNLVISGISVAAMKSPLAQRPLWFRVGEAVLEVFDDCAPCSRMEEALGQGGYNAMRDHGGMVARIVEGGMIRVGDVVAATDGRGHGGS
jgi:MOSC domain-containing protein YiiM